MRTRRAFSLVELLIVMAAASTVLTLSATLIHRAMRAHTRAQTIQADERTAWRLSAQFRRDVRGAIDAAVVTDNGATGFTLQQPVGEPIRYRFEGPLVTRVEQLEDSAKHDEFAFVGGPVWTLAEAASPRRLVLSADSASHAPTRPGIPPPVRLHLEARLQSEAPQ